MWLSQAVIALFWWALDPKPAGQRERWYTVSNAVAALCTADGGSGCARVGA